MRVTSTDVSALARHLFTTQGPDAIAEVLHNAASCRKAGDREQAQVWERVEAALRELRGPHQS